MQFPRHPLLDPNSSTGSGSNSNTNSNTDTFVERLPLLTSSSTEKGKDTTPNSSSNSKGTIHVKDRDAIFDPYYTLVKGEEVPQESMTNILFLLLNTAIGTGFLNQGYVFFKSGLLSTTFILYPIAIYTCTYGMYLMIEIGVLTGSKDYAETCDLVLGTRWSSLQNVAVVMDSYGVACAYFVLFVGMMEDLIQYWSNCSTDDDISGYYSDSSTCWLTSGVFLCFLSFLLLLPVVQLKHYGEFTATSIFSTVIFIIVAILILIYGPIIGSAEGDTSDSILYWNTLGSLQSTGSVVYSLQICSVSFHAYRAINKQDRSLPTWWALSFSVTLLAGGAFWLIGLIVYLSFRDSTEANILDNFINIYACGQAMKIMYIIKLMAAFPQDFIVLRYSLLKVLGYKTPNEVDTLTHVLTNTILLFTVAVLIGGLFAAGYDDSDIFDNIIDIVGATSGGLLAFIIPGMLFIGVFGFPYATDFKYFQRKAESLKFEGLTGKDKTAPELSNLEEEQEKSSHESTGFSPPVMSNENNNNTIDCNRCQQIQRRIDVYLENLLNIAESKKNNEDKIERETNEVEKVPKQDLERIHTITNTLLIRQGLALSLIVIGTILFFLVPLLILFTDCN